MNTTTNLTVDNVLRNCVVDAQQLRKQIVSHDTWSFSTFYGGALSALEKTIAIINAMESDSLEALLVSLEWEYEQAIDIVFGDSQQAYYAGRADALGSLIDQIRSDSSSIKGGIHKGERTMNDKKYNGWTNYETWCVNRWLHNDQGSDNYWRAIAVECWVDSANCDRVERGVWTRELSAIYHLSGRIENNIHEAIPSDLSSTMLGDLLGASLSKVCWCEIAAHYIEDVDKDDDDDSSDD